MKKKDWINIWLILNDTYKKDKKRIICMALMAFMEVIPVYIEIFLLGEIVDSCYIGVEVGTLVKYIVGIFLIRYVCVIIEKVAHRYYDTKLDYTKDIETKYMNQKSMRFSYELLENSSVADLRYRAFDKSYYGIVGWCLLNVKGLLKGFFSIIITMCLVVPAIFSNSQNISFIGSKYISFLMLLVVIILTLVNYKVGVYYTNKAKDEINKAENYYNRKQYYLEKFSNIEFQKDVRISKLNDAIMQDVEAMYYKLVHAEYKHGNLYIKRERLGGVLMGLNFLVAYLFAGLRAMAGLITAGNVIVVASSILKFSAQMIFFAAALGNMKSVALFAKDYLDFMELSDDVSDCDDTCGSKNVSTVEFRNVSFKYPNENKYVLQEINVKFNSNERIAIVGENGSGKTTLIKLLCGFYNDYEGDIFVDGKNIKKLKKREYWKNLSIVFQDFNILSFSIRDNFTTRDDDKIIKALEKAGLKVSSLDDKIGKTIYLEGRNFSGGELQKIAIARSIYKKADFVIMDEPTAALDPVAENEVYSGFDNLIDRSGGVFISHRLSSCMFCERIIVMKEGKIVQQGNHKHLVGQEGDYKLLWNAQKECYE